LIRKLEYLAADFTVGGDAEWGLLMYEPVDHGEAVVLDPDGSLAGTLCSKLETGENGGPFSFCGGVGVCAFYITIRTATIGGDEDVGCAG
jgi:hypothetical protein